MEPLAFGPTTAAQEKEPPAGTFVLLEDVPPGPLYMERLAAALSDAVRARCEQEGFTRIETSVDFAPSGDDPNVLILTCTLRGWK